MRQWESRLTAALVILFALIIIYWLTLQPPVQVGIKDVATYNETALLPWWIGRTMIRMTSAYLLTLAFGLTYGIYAGLHQRASRVMLPVLDIFQSIPVIGFMLPVFVFVLAIIPGVLGQEISSIFLIFTGMAWAVAFNTYGAVRSIPAYIVEASKAFNISGSRYTREVILPAIFPALISGSILAWGGGWYFLIASEYFSLGSTGTVSLPGLGTYIFQATQFTPPHLGVAFFGLFIMAGIVALINQLVWHPLLDYSTRFSQESLYATHYRRRKAIIKSKVSQTVYREFLAATRPISAATSANPLSRLIHTHPLPLRSPLFSGRIVLPSVRPKIRLATYLITGAILTVIVIILLMPITGESPLSFVMNLKVQPLVYTIPYAAFRSILRLSAGYFIALAWTLVAGIAVARSRRLASILMPLFDIGQSVPALALFPIVVIIVISAYGAIGVEISSVILILTGMQWYILFNIISSVRSIPTEILESARAFGFRGTRFFRHVLLPAIFPGIVIGSIQAWGGGWNASIVSEYIQLGNQTYIAPGLGALLQTARYQKTFDPLLFLLTLIAMSVTVIILNRTIWRYLFHRAEKYRFET